MGTILGRPGGNTERIKRAWRRVYLTEAVELTTASGRAMVGMLAVFAEFEQEIRSERIREGIALARLEGRKFGRPKSAGLKVKQIKRLFSRGLTKSEIARRLGIGRTSVRRLLDSGNSAN